MEFPELEDISSIVVISESEGEIFEYRVSTINDARKVKSLLDSDNTKIVVRKHDGTAITVS